LIKKIINWFGRLLLAHFIVGSVYYLSGFLYNISEGKEIVFSPIIGYPLAVIGWPLSLRADFIHRDSLGLKPTLVVTILAVVIVLTWLVIRAIKDYRAAKS